MNRIAKVVSSSLAAAVLLCALPAAADAAVKIVKPEKLRPMSSSMDYTSMPMITSMNVGTGSFFAELKKLPVGARITGLKVWTSNTGGPAGFVTVYRMKASELDIFGAGDIMDVDLSTATAIWQQLSETSTGPASNRVQRGYRYFVRATLNNTAAMVGAITVSYTP